MREENTTFVRRIKHTAMCVGLALFLAGTVVPVEVGYARPSPKTEEAFPDYYPDGFNGQGPIDRIAADEVVINDTLFKLSPDVEYHTRTTQNASSAWFSAGKFVGYITNSNLEIVSLWLIQ